MTYTQGDWNVLIVDGQARIICTSPTKQCYILIAGNLYDEEHEVSLEEVNGNATLMALAPKMYEALQKIAEGKGAYSMDRLTHAENTIEDMKTLAQEVLARIS